jgi:hypothetical protein
MRRRGLKVLVGASALTLGINLGINLFVTARFPMQVLFHSPAPGWALRTSWQCAGLAALVLLLPRLAWGLALFVGGSLANVASALLWAGAPDYIYYHDHVINSSDLTLVSGEAVIIATLGLLIRTAWQDYRRSIQPVSEV